MTIAAESPTIVTGAALTAKQAKQLLDIEKTVEMIEGQKWYLLDLTWWLDFVRRIDEHGENASDLIKMPPISNEALLSGAPKDQFSNELKPNLQDQVHYVLLPEEVFSELKSAYGVVDEERDVIAREVIKGTLMQANTFIEVYPLLIHMADYSEKSRVYTVPISQGDSLEKIRQRILDELSLNETERKNALFYVEDNDQYEALSESISYTKLSALLNAGSTIYVDSSGTAAPSGNTPPPPAASNDGATRAGTVYTAYNRTGSNTNIQHGVCGLQNLGNTCFMNSALQCLSNVPELTDYFLSDSFLNDINEKNPLGTQGRLVHAYAELLKEMWSGQMSSVRPFRLKCVIGEFAPRFNGYAQQDSQELTAFLLDGLHEDLNRIKKKPYIEEKEVEGRDEAEAAEDAWKDYKRRNDSVIVELMHGQLKSTLTCNVCQKVSVKFDPFCFLSVPIPAKERQMKSTITFVRKQKWAKFSITHTNKTTASQIKQKLREQLKVPDESQIVLIAYFSADIVDDDQQIGSPYGYGNAKQFYAYAVDEPGPVLLVENRATDFVKGSLLGLPFPVKRPEKFTRRFVLDHVLPQCRDYFWRERRAEGTASEDRLNGNEMGMGGGGEDEQRENGTADELLPVQICFDKWNAANGNSDYVFPDGPDEEVPFPDGEGPLPKLVLKWQEIKQFHNVNVDNLVEREVNMISAVKKTYTLKECIDLYMSREQLNEEDSWYCPRCKAHQRAFKKLDLWALPQILIIHLKRFIYSRYTRDKIDTEIEIPVRGLDFSDKVLNPAHKQEKYDLIGIDNHSGGLGSGHYTARALNGNAWCEFNDSNAYQLHAQLSDTIVSREAYMLVYRRRESSQAQQRKSQRIAAMAAGEQQLSATITNSSSGSSSNSSGSGSSSSGSSGTCLTVSVAFKQELTTISESETQLSGGSGSSGKRRISESKMETD